jgi:anti-sigma regulatory factor (Ser/Thr protein kinase)
MDQTRCVRIGDESGVGAARREAAQLARIVGLDERTAGRVAIVVSELGKNAWRHAQGGDVLLRALDHGVEILVLDKGPGMTDVGRALGDGYSTRGTAGTGLGAVQRQSQAFDIYSQPGAGTAVLARVTTDARAEARPPVGAVCIAKPGEEVAGDSWTSTRTRGRAIVLVADGLGHGPDAAVAARAATAIVAQHGERAPTEILQLAHEALRATRGAAVAVAVIDADAHTLTFAGIGNVFGQILRSDGATTAGLASSYGTIGGDLRKVNEESFAFAEHDLVLLATDGVRPRWQWSSYSGLPRRDPSLVAGVLYRDFFGGRDDATVVVLR